MNDLSNRVFTYPAYSTTNTPLDMSGVDLFIPVPQTMLKNIIGLMLVLTDLGVYDDSLGYDEHDTRVQKIHEIIANIGECMVDCEQVNDCLPNTSNFQSAMRAIANNQQLTEQIASDSALARYVASGNNIAVYNPSVPVNWSAPGVPNSDLWLCVVATTFTVEFARKISNFSSLMTGLSNVVLSFGGLIGAITPYIPVWLSSISNYVVMPLVGYAYQDYLDMYNAANDEGAVALLSCKLRDTLTGKPVSYSEYIATLNALPMSIGYPLYNELRERMILYCSNEQAYLYFCDLLALTYDESDTTLQCACSLAPSVWIGYDYRVGQHGSYNVAGADRGFYASGGYRYSNATFWDRLHIEQPTGSISARYIHVFQYRVAQNGYTTSNAITVRAYNSSGVQIGAATKVQWNGLTGEFEGMPYLTLDMGSIVSGIAKIEVFQIAANNSAVADYRLYALGYS